MHSDLWRPATATSKSGHLYFVSFIDDFQGIHGFISWNINQKCILLSKSLKHFQKIKQGERLKGLE